MPDRKKLNLVIGRWMATGHVVATDGSEGSSITAVDIYEWDANHTHLILKAASQIGDQRFGGTETLAVADDEIVTSHPFNLGIQYSSSSVEIEDGMWVWGGDKQKCGRIFARWPDPVSHHQKRDSDGNWVPAMEVILRKIPHANVA